MQKIDQVIENRILAANLEDQTCALKHSTADPAEDHTAIDYLGIHTGMASGKTDTLLIPICQDCLDALCGHEWVLIYCVNCNRSQWIHRHYAKRRYKDDDHVIFLTMCPHCYDKKERVLH